MSKRLQYVCLLFVGFILLIAVAPPQCTVAQDKEIDPEDDEPVEFLPGLVAHYDSSLGSFRRIDADVAFDGQYMGTDSRLSTDQSMTVAWKGLLQCMAPGKHTFKIFTSGRAVLKLDGNPLIDAQAGPNPSEWLESAPVELTFGRHEIQISFEAIDAAPRIGLYWTGPEFQLEPIPARLLSHSVAETFEDKYRVGRTLSRGLRCGGCHTYPNVEPNVLRAPSLTYLQENLRPSWLVQHVTSTGATANTSSQRRMPHFGMHRNDAAAISAALFAASATSRQPESVKDQLIASAKKQRKRDPAVRTEADVQAGATVFASVGCLACHQSGQLGAPDSLVQKMYSGGDLSKVSTKRTRAFFQRWLVDPSLVNEHHRMPAIDLSLTERLDLAAYLESLGQADSRNDTQASGDLHRGAGLIANHRCGACHQLPAKLQTPIAKIALTANSNWDAGCLTQPNGRASIPGYQLASTQRAALKTFVCAEYPPASTDESPIQLIAENNCLACHKRDAVPGIEVHLSAISKQFSNLAVRVSALSPPALTGVGDKLHKTALENAIARKGDPLRPWLDVRMPKFEFTAKQLSTIANFLIAHDRIPPVASEQEPVRDPLAQTSVKLAASRLVTSDGFGCQSCHKIGNTEPPKVDLKAKGTDLTMLGQRIRSEWFQRWVRNPARIVPRMEMPAIKIPVHGVLSGSLDRQLDALWETLNTPGFQPPTPNPTTVVRSWNTPNTPKSINVLTDVIESQDHEYLKPLVVGFANRHNVLIDLESATLAKWWIGDTAYQQTRGKTWYWELGNIPLHEGLLQSYNILDENDRTWNPKPKGQFAAQLTSLRHEPRSLTWTATVNFALDDQFRQLEFRQTLVPGESEGFLVQTLVRGLNANERFVVNTPEHPGDMRVVVNYESSRGQERGGEAFLTSTDGECSFSTHFESATAADQYPYREVTQVHRKALKLTNVPGFQTTQLPLPISEMPVSLAWDPSGAFYVGSLKGNVLKVTDTDGDGLEDSYKNVAGNFPAPYGIQAYDDHVDVLTKFGLLRLTDLQNDRFQTAEVLADDWGYTHDYHDWAVGLERDPQGNYYVALPCQQDDRSPAAAHRRGTAFKLVPYEDKTGKSVYRVEQISAGLRFPMGIALSKSGDLFTTDNQGNYNPFNELNHLRSGKRYGFINKLENKNGFSPPFESPAINLPHPWTRSVNGICFLDTPDALKRKTGVDHFGPFEGHLVGCEMNGLALVRLSLQQVGGSYQGAAYMLSKPAAEGEPQFEGPIVCEVSPQGDVFVGSLQDSGWGGGQNTGSIVRLRPDDIPPGIAEVRATSSGFEVIFTRPVDRDRASDLSNYAIRSYRRISTPAYGGDDQDSRSERVESLQVSDDGLRVTLHLPSLRAGFVYELNLQSLTTGHQEFFPSQAHYTMRAIPQ